MRTTKNSSSILASKSARTVIGCGFAFVVWMFFAARLDHRCLLGYKWFEHNGPFFVAVTGVCCIVFVRRLWLGVSLAAAIYLCFFFMVIPQYLAWIHGPNHPRFPAAEAEQARVLEELRRHGVTIKNEASKADRTLATPK